MRVSWTTVLWWCLREARPIVQGIFLLRLVSGWALTVHWPPGLPAGSVVRLAFGVVAWFCVVMSVYLLNGVTDVAEDRVNASRRPIAQGLLSPRVAVRVVWALAVLGVAAALVASVWLGLLAVVLLTVGWCYSVPSWRFKRRSSGVATAVLILTGATYYAGAVIASDQDWPATHPPQPGVELLIFGGALVAWAALVGGTTKELPDLTGDQAVGSHNWLTRWGEQRFRYVVSVVALLVGGAFLAAAAGLATRLLPAAAVLLAGGATVAVVLLTPDSHGSRSARRRPYRAFMLTQYSAHLVLAAGV